MCACGVPGSLESHRAALVCPRRRDGRSVHAARRSPPSHSALSRSLPHTASRPLVPPARARRLDTSEYTRNGDYAPTRLESQHDAVTTLVVGKLGRNAESTVGLLTHGGTGCV